MKPILWIDRQILKFFNKIAKDFNWLTGLDNFFLAVLSLGLAFLGFFLYSIVFDAGTLFMMFVCVSFAVLCLGSYEIKTSSLFEQMNNIKDPALYWLLFCFRTWLLFVSILGFDFFKQDKSELILIVSFLFMWAWACFLSIDQPPFKKSQAWQKIKNWFKIPSSQTELKPVPITIPHN